MLSNFHEVAWFSSPIPNIFRANACVLIGRYNSKLLTLKCFFDEYITHNLILFWKISRLYVTMIRFVPCWQFIVGMRLCLLLLVLTYYGPNLTYKLNFFSFSVILRLSTLLIQIFFRAFILNSFLVQIYVSKKYLPALCEGYIRIRALLLYVRTSERYDSNMIYIAAYSYIHI